MKKVLFAMFAIAALAACSNDETISRSQDGAIKFDNVFVEKSTRAADILTSSNTDLGLYGSVNKGDDYGKIFNNERVYHNGTAYTYDHTQYWVGNARYDFVAFAPYTGAQWAYTTTNDVKNGSLAFDNETAAANQDLLFTYASRTTDDSVGTPQSVLLDCGHMLSRVKFTFTNGFADYNNIELKVYDVTITNAHADGTLAITNGVAGDWVVGANTFEHNFGLVGDLAAATSGSTEHFYLIPTTATYNLTFKVDIKQAGVKLDTYARTATVDLNMVKGHSYNVKTTLDYENTSDEGALLPIEFSVTVSGWNDSWSEVDAETTY